jgi:Uma2 family endonuclease
MTPMATESRRILLTYDDLQEMPDDRNRYEIIRGHLEVTPAPSPDHQKVVLNLAAVLHRHVLDHSLGTVFVAPCDVFFSEHSVVEPDIFFVPAEREDIIDSRMIRGAPKLVVEVLCPSTTRRDRQAKMQLYAEFGVQHYWIVDPVHRTIDVHALGTRDYELLATVPSTSSFLPELFPNLEINGRDLWR